MAQGGKYKRKTGEENDPTLLGVIVGTIAGLVIGLGLAFSKLAVMEVAEVKEMPKAEEIKTYEVYYIKNGKRDASFDPVIKWIQDAEATGSKTITPEQLNSWAQKSFKAPSPEEQGDFNLTVIPEQPDFRVLENGKLQISSRLNSSLGEARKPIYIAIGSFKDGDFVVERSRVGHFPLPPVGPIQQFFLGFVSGSMLDATEVDEGWATVSSAEITESGIAITK